MKIRIKETLIKWEGPVAHQWRWQFRMDVKEKGENT